jgi:hypothetical protein
VKYAEWSSAMRVKKQLGVKGVEKQSSAEP